MRPNLLFSLALVGVAIVGTLSSLARMGWNLHLEQWLLLLPHALVICAIFAARRSEVAAEICMVVAGAMAALSCADVLLPIAEGHDSILEPGFRRACVWFAEMSVATLLFGGVLAYRWTYRTRDGTTSADA